MSDEVLKEMHSELAKQLLARIKSGEATASDFNVARQFLKDNNVDAIPKAGSPLNDLISNLPFHEDNAFPQ